MLLNIYKFATAKTVLLGVPAEESGTYSTLKKLTLKPPQTQPVHVNCCVYVQYVQVNVGYVGRCVLYGCLSCVMHIQKKIDHACKQQTISSGLCAVECFVAFTLTERTGEGVVKDRIVISDLLTNGLIC